LALVFKKKRVAYRVTKFFVFFSRLYEYWIMLVLLIYGAESCARIKASKNKKKMELCGKAGENLKSKRS
jgi:hypothetical protein